MKRKIIQIAVTGGMLYALCDDGTVWSWDSFNEWKQIPSLVSSNISPDDNH